MKHYKHHRYTWTNVYSIRHNWEFVGPKGAVNFHVTLVEGYDPSAGLEFHHLEGQGAPDRVDCPLTGSRCWHDGTSLYAIEHVWPVVEGYLKCGEHQQIFSYLEKIATDHFEPNKEET